MHNLPSSIQNLRPSDGQSNIPTVLPLPDAARKYGLTEQALTQLIQTGKIEAVQLPSGEILVSADNNRKGKTKEQVIADDFAELRGQRITVSEAAQKYNLHRDTVLEWVKKNYITAFKQGGRGSRMELDEADVAYCADIYKKRKAEGTTGGAPLLDSEGLPYRLKNPVSAKHRRELRRKNKLYNRG